VATSLTFDKQRPMTRVTFNHPGTIHHAEMVTHALIKF